VSSTGKEIVTKLAVFAAISGSVLTLSATSATASPVTRDSAKSQDGDTYMEVSGDRNDWTFNSWCVKCGYHGHFHVFFPNGREYDSPDSDNPKLLNVHGTGAGKLRVLNWRPTPSGYENMGKPSVKIE
jgi:hypothetical protein